MSLPRGFWRRRSEIVPTQPEFLEVTPDRLRILCSAVIDDSPKIIPMGMSYEDIQDGEVRLRFRPTAPWATYRYRIETGLIDWNWGGADQRWEEIEESNLPEWWSRFRDKAFQRMDQRELDFEALTKND